MSQKAEGARKTTQRDDYKRRPRCRFPALCRSAGSVRPRRSLRSSCFVTGTELFVEGGFAQV